MTNPERGEGHGFEGTDGKWHEFHFDLNAICAWESKTGKGLGTLSKLKSDPSSASFSDIRALVWAGLLHERLRAGKKSTSPMTLEQAGALVPPAATIDVMGAVAEALAASIGADDEAEESEGEPSGEAGGDPSAQ